MFKILKKYRKVVLAISLIFGLWYYFCLPKPLFNDPFAGVLVCEKGNLLGARIATDGQWRFPKIDSIPNKFEQAILTFEDQRFYKHIGVDFKSMCRAFLQNIRNGAVVSGGSTLSMQVIRLSRKNRKRTVWNKLVEVIQATRLELGYSKKEILKLYATHAPFGGNVVGLETASWRYFNKPPFYLSWGEAATLAVLPNSPGLIHPGRNRQLLREKRDRLLKRMLEKQLLDSMNYQLALEEYLPEAPSPMPMLAPHLLERLLKQKNTKGKIKSTIDYQMQQKVQKIIDRYQNIYAQNGIHNAAAFVLEVETGKVKAYVGNASDAGSQHSGSVDIITAPRSTGSLLKPILYGLAINDGTILPQSLIQDVPTIIQGYRPENFNKSYDGLVPADKALIRSLNIPFVLLLQKYGLEKFHFELQQLGLATINQPPNHYGLTLILGGAEGSLETLTNLYAGMARTLNHYNTSDGEYLPDDFKPAIYLQQPIEKKSKSDWRFTPGRMSAAAIWQTVEAMRKLERPDSEGQWQQFSSSKRIAWKTGTSFGFRDAWAIGISPDYVVGIWIGNADGEGRPGLVGVKKAAPLLFDIFDLLPTADWFEKPLDEFTSVRICQKSGYRALPFCPSDSVMVPNSGLKSKPCPYHNIIQLDSTKSYRVNTSCYLPQEMHSVPWFVLPPMEASYYQLKNPDLLPLPPWGENCTYETAQDKNIQLIYPKRNTKVYLPIDFDGQRSKVVLKAAHRNPQKTIFWHLGENYLGTTQHFHSIEIAPNPGIYKLVLVDETGDRLETSIEFLKKSAE